MNHKELRVTLIVPTMNEAESLKVILPRIKKEWYDELIIVDGGSTDGTVEYCQSCGYSVLKQRGRGLPMALVDALEKSTGDILITFSPDGNSIPELMPALVEKIREGYDMVIVSRYLGHAQSYDDDIFTGFGNKMFTALTSWFFGVRYSDVLVIYRAYRREAVMAMRLDRHEEENWIRKNFFYMNSWELGSCIRAAELGLKITEIPGDEPARIGDATKHWIPLNGTGALLQIIYEWIVGWIWFKRKK